MSVDAHEACETPKWCMSFNSNSGAAPPLEAKYESGSRVNLHPGVMARGDGLHPAALWQNYPGDLCPRGQDIAAPTDVRGCPVPYGRSVATQSLGPIEVSPRGIVPLGRQAHEPRGSALGLRDNAQNSCWRHLGTILEEEPYQLLELELEEGILDPGHHTTVEECIEGPRGLSLEVQSVKKASDSSQSLKVVPKAGIEFVPIQGSDQAAGYDVKASEDAIIPPGQRRLIPLGIMCQCPEGTYIRLAPQSSLAWKKEIDVGAGVVDRDYRGN